MKILFNRRTTKLFFSAVFFDTKIVCLLPNTKITTPIPINFSINEKELKSSGDENLEIKTEISIENNSERPLIIP